MREETSVEVLCTGSRREEEKEKIIEKTNIK